jgi:tRNA C32,U32 (ribose-2'-O)-methylase TrmJ
MASPKTTTPNSISEQSPISATATAAPSEGPPDEAVTPEQIDDVFKDLKTLLTTVEKLQKAREDVQHMKPLLVRLLDGELLAGDELEQLKGDIGSLAKLVKLYSDYQVVLEQAQPARALLDQVLKA